MTSSRTGVGTAGVEARGSGAQRLRRQGGEGEGRGGGRGAGGLPAAGTGAPGAGRSPGRLQQAAGGNRLVFFNSWFDITKAEP